MTEIPAGTPIPRASARAPGYALGVVLVAGAALCWSTGGALVRLTAGIDSWQIILYRSLTVFVLIAAWIAMKHGRKAWAAVRAAGPNAAIAGAAVAIAGLTFIMSLFYTTVAQAIFMVGIAPFLSAILGFWILRERIPGITWAAMAVALTGMAVILFASGAGEGSLMGSMLAIYSAFAFSCYAVLLRWGQNTDMSVALVWNAVFLIAAALIVLLLPTGLRQAAGLGELNIGFRNALICFVMGAVQLTLGLLLFTWGSRSVPAAQLTLIALVEPVFSPLWAWLVAGELPPVLTFAGGAIILGAIVLQTLLGARNRGSRRLAQSRMADDVLIDAPRQDPHLGQHRIGLADDPSIGSGTQRFFKSGNVTRQRFP
jgi:drug/metabolite transporter (DMT)-like permease